MATRRKVSFPKLSTCIDIECAEKWIHRSGDENQSSRRDDRPSQGDRTRGHILDSWHEQREGSVLNTLLKKAAEWDVIERMPCNIKLLPVIKAGATFHDFSEYERLVDAAHAIGWRTHLIVLFGGEAGLRCGEMVALEWRDVDVVKRQLCVRQSDWRGQVTAPKNGRVRYVPLTERLAATLRGYRHLRSQRVLCKDDGTPLTRQDAWSHVRYAARRADVPTGVHILRHTFCSHLAMLGAPGKAIQELAGHQELGTTSRYMHLSPAARESAIKLLEKPNPQQRRGEMLETEKTANAS